MKIFPYFLVLYDCKIWSKAFSSDTADRDDNWQVHRPDGSWSLRMWITRQSTDRLVLPKLADLKPAADTITTFKKAILTCFWMLHIQRRQRCNTTMTLEWDFTTKHLVSLWLSGCSELRFSQSQLLWAVRMSPLLQAALPNEGSAAYLQDVKWWTDEKRRGIHLFSHS